MHENEINIICKYCVNTCEEDLNEFQIIVDSQDKKIKKLEERMQKPKDEINKLKKEYEDEIKSMTIKY